MDDRGGIVSLKNLLRRNGGVFTISIARPRRELPQTLVAFLLTGAALLAAWHQSWWALPLAFWGALLAPLMSGGMAGAVCRCGKPECPDAGGDSAAPDGGDNGGGYL